MHVCWQGNEECNHGGDEAQTAKMYILFYITNENYETGIFHYSSVKFYDFTEEKNKAKIKHQL